MGMRGECKSCKHFLDYGMFCTKLKTCLWVSRNPYHPGLIIRPDECGRLQHYKENEYETPTTGWMCDDD